MKYASELEAMFAVHMRADKLPTPEREYQVNPARKWRVDFAYPEIRLAIEVDGAVHRIRERFHADIEKHAWLVLNGWTLLRVGGREVRSGQAIAWLKSLLWERAPASFFEPKQPRAVPHSSSHAGELQRSQTIPIDTSDPAYTGRN